jgi:hypothetical protein
VGAGFDDDFVTSLWKVSKSPIHSEIAKKTTRKMRVGSFDHREEEDSW